MSLMLMTPLLHHHLYPRINKNKYMHFAFTRIHFQQWPNMSTEFYLNIYRIYVYRIYRYSQIIDKWGIAQSTGQNTSGMWMKYGTKKKIFLSFLLISMVQQLNHPDLGKPVIGCLKQSAQASLVPYFIHMPLVSWSAL